MFNPEQLSIDGIKILSGHIESPFEFDEEQVKGYNVNMDLKLASNVDIDRIKADLLIEVSTDSNVSTNEKETHGNFRFAYIFKCENLNSLAEIQEDKMILDPHLSNSVAAISYSTARGILLTRFQGTSLSKFILPVINTGKLFNLADIETESND